MDDTYQTRRFKCFETIKQTKIVKRQLYSFVKEEDGVVQWKQPLYYNRKMTILETVVDFRANKGRL